jgi:hypothetical protein
MDILPELVVDLQSSSARGAAAMSLAMCLAHIPELNLDRVTSDVPPTADVNALLDAVSGYDTRTAWRIRHDEFYDKVVLMLKGRASHKLMLKGRASRELMMKVVLLRLRRSKKLIPAGRKQCIILAPSRVCNIT